jgi:hypothetical protein
MSNNCFNDECNRKRKRLPGELRVVFYFVLSLVVWSIAILVDHNGITNVALLAGFYCIVAAIFNIFKNAE